MIDFVKRYRTSFLLVVGILMAILWVKGMLYLREGVLADADPTPSGRERRASNDPENLIADQLIIDYWTIEENNLFRPLGWTPEIMYQPPMMINRPLMPPPVEREAQRKPLSALMLTGIVQDGDRWVVIVEDRTAKEGYFISQGENIKDCNVTSITPEYIVLKSNDREAKLKLGDSIYYDASGQILFDVDPSISATASANVAKVDEDGTNTDDIQSLIEKMRARRQKELGLE